MKLGKDWKIEVDSKKLNVLILKRMPMKRKDTGEHYDAWIVKGFFASPKEALRWFVDQKIRDTGLTDLKSITEMITELHKTIDGLVVTVAL